MSYSDMLASFKVILNRSDCSDAQSREFVNQGVRRIQRDCRLPSMERQQIIDVGSSGTDMILVPQDLIQLQDIIWTPGPNSNAAKPRALKKAGGYRDLLARSGCIIPEWYARVQSQYWIAGKAVNGDSLQVLYYGNFSNWATADSENELSASSPDLCVYAALSYAGDYFECAQTMSWESRYQAIKGEFITMADQLEAEGGPQVMQSPYRWE